MSSERAIGEAEAALSSRAEAAGVTDPEAFAHEYVTAMLHAGWRHRARPVVSTDPNTGEKAMPQQELLEETRARIADAQVALKRAENEHFNQIRKQVRG